VLRNFLVLIAPIFAVVPGTESTKSSVTTPTDDVQLLLWIKESVKAHLQITSEMIIIVFFVAECPIQSLGHSSNGPHIISKMTYHRVMSLVLCSCIKIQKDPRKQK